MTTRTSVRSGTHEPAFGVNWGIFADMELALVRRPVPTGPLPAGAEVTGRGYARPPILPLVQVDPIDRSHWRNALPILWPQAGDDWGAADTLAVVLPQQGGYVLAQTTLPAGFRVGKQQQLQIMRYRLDLFAVAPDCVRPYGTGAFGVGLFGACAGAPVLPDSLRPYGAGASGVGPFGASSGASLRPYGTSAFGIRRFGRGGSAAFFPYPGGARPYGTGRYGLSQFGAYPAAGEVFAVLATVSEAWAQQGQGCAPWAAAPAIVSGGCCA